VEGKKRRKGGDPMTTFLAFEKRGEGKGGTNSRHIYGHRQEEGGASLVSCLIYGVKGRGKRNRRRTE